jgi:Flp pilus assembly protein TadB
MNNIFYSLAERLYCFFPRLDTDLSESNTNIDALEYMSKSLYISSLSSLIVFVTTTFAMQLSRNSGLEVVIASTVCTFTFTLFFKLKQPHQSRITRAKRIEKSLIFGLHALNVEMSSGVKFMDAVKNVSQAGYGEFSKELRLILLESQKTDINTALMWSSKRVPSKIYQRLIWQLLNSIETGADVKGNIRSIIDDLRRRQEEEAKRYGKTLEKSMVFYIMGAIVLPALSVVLLQTISSMGLSQFIVNESTYWTILLFSISVQLIFLFLVKFQKPPLLSLKTGLNIHKQNLKNLLDYSGFNITPRNYLILVWLIIK